MTVRWLFTEISLIAWNVEKTLFDSWPTVAWPPTNVAWPFSDFFQNLPNCLNRQKNVVWQSSNVRVTSDHCLVTVERLFSKFFLINWNDGKMWFESQQMVAWLSGYFASVFLHTFPHMLAGICLSRYYSYFFPTYSLATYLLLQENSNPGNFDIISKLGISRREFLILAGKFHLVDSL